MTATSFRTAGGGVLAISIRRTKQYVIRHALWLVACSFRKSPELRQASLLLCNALIEIKVVRALT
jgi:hypothetical protein